MDIWRYRAVNHILLIDINVHVCDGPLDLLGLDSADMLPVVGVLCVEEDDVGLAGAVVKISFGREPSSIDPCIRDIILLVQI